MMSDRVKEYLLKLSRSTIISKLEGKKIPETPADETPAEAAEDVACFVTLTKNGDLRGCIGSMEPQDPLYKDVIRNSLNAAFSDPRFSPLRKNEAEEVRIEISVLSPRQIIEYNDFADLKKKVIPGKHGVYLSYLYNSATFLPQVWEQLYTHEQFFIHLSQKAGLSPDFIFFNHPKIEVYTVEHFSE